MTSHSAIVFGISEGPFSDAGDYSFVDVIGVVEDDRVVAVEDPKEAFPERGSVFLSEKFWIPPRGVGAIWRVNRQPPGVSHSADFAVVATGRKGPLEIVPLLANADEPGDIRKSLLKGINLPFVPYGEVLFELRDGSVIGPVRADSDRHENFNGFFCSEEAFLDPLRRWADARELEPLTVIHRGSTRRFSSYMQLPPHTDLLDTSDFETRVSQVLRFAADSEDGFNLTKTEIQGISQLLSDRELSTRVVTRADEVLQAIRDGALAKERAAALASQLATIEPLRSEIESIREEAREEEIDRMGRFETGMQERIQGLIAEEDRLEAEIEAHRTAISEAGEEAASLVTKRIRDVQADAAGLLADVVVLKPFLSSSGSPTDANLGFSVHEDGRETDDAETLEAALTGLAQSLTRLGVLKSEAQAIAREVCAAAISGQVTTFIGSLADIVARECTLCLGGGATMMVRIPYGLLRHDSLADVLREAQRIASGSRTLTTVLLHGMNRSALEAYGDDLRTTVEEIALGDSGPLDQILCVGSAIDGASTLPLTQLYSDLGPVLDTDSLVLKPGQDAERSGCRIKLADWKAWSQTGRSTEVSDPGAFRDILAEFDEVRSVLWEANAGNALRALGHVSQEGSASTELHSLLFGWVLTRARQVGILTPELADKWNDLSDDLGEDLRIGRVLSSLR